MIASINAFPFEECSNRFDLDFSTSFNCWFKSITPVGSSFGFAMFFPTIERRGIKFVWLLMIFKEFCDSVSSYSFLQYYYIDKTQSNASSKEYNLPTNSNFHIDFDILNIEYNEPVN